MKKVLVSLLIVLLPLTNTYAASVEVNWIKPEKYTDVRAGQESRKRFRERTFKKFEAHFQKLASKLPEQQKIVINVTNVDLAGDVTFNMKRIRIIKDIYIPRMKFNYQLLNADGKVLKQEDVDLKDMGFMMHANSRIHNDALRYEKVMLNKWFKSTFDI